MMTITQTKTDSSLTIALDGRLDTTSAPDLEAVCKNGLDGVSELTIDMEKLDYMSSAGLRVILAMQKRMLEQGSMKVVNVNEIIMEIFEITGFADILTIE